MARVTVHKFKCNRSDESGDGDEVWVRLIGSTTEIRPGDRQSTFNGVRTGTFQDIEMTVDFEGSATFDLFEDDDWYGGDVETRDNEHLGHFIFDTFSNSVQNQWVELLPGAADKDTSYQICYSLTL